MQTMRCCWFVLTYSKRPVCIKTDILKRLASIKRDLQKRPTNESNKNMWTTSASDSCSPTLKDLHARKKTYKRDLHPSKETYKRDQQTNRTRTCVPWVLWICVDHIMRPVCINTDLRKRPMPIKTDLQKRSTHVSTQYIFSTSASDEVHPPPSFNPITSLTWVSTKISKSPSKKR